MNAFLTNQSGPDWKTLGRSCVLQCVELFWDAALWLGAILVLGLANVVLALVHLPPRAAALMETVHLNTVYATILVASAGAVTRLVVAALERLGHWNNHAG